MIEGCVGGDQTRDIVRFARCDDLLELLVRQVGSDLDEDRFSRTGIFALHSCEQIGERLLRL